jgi:hypothetical protein
VKGRLLDDFFVLLDPLMNTHATALDHALADVHFFTYDGDDRALARRNVKRLDAPGLTDLARTIWIVLGRLTGGSLNNRLGLDVAGFRAEVQRAILHTVGAGLEDHRLIIVAPHHHARGPARIFVDDFVDRPEWPVRSHHRHAALWLVHISCPPTSSEAMQPTCQS